ncbi:hypothetical protein BU25DRAFT_418006 [Macroventuria anomochaeta]|uniref:Uncharacterized protein n=1 Tax=Macroventuria anomochaeta TaxID=301207 RepID=A0ACB6SDK6_9PLEO|nr:uncharacterized protein BU25DRAFT_418006 [Macroventuria anomochaeta]KAF2632296.1 hypothetical protein BU25DRAFT_418006 [Macroventuria anomochaeta]
MTQTLQEIRNDVLGLPPSHIARTHNLKSMIICTLSPKNQSPPPNHLTAQLQGMCFHHAEQSSFDVLHYTQDAHFVTVAVACRKDGAMFERLAEYSSKRNVLGALEKMWIACLKAMGVWMDVVERHHGEGCRGFRELVRWAISLLESVFTVSEAITIDIQIEHMQKQIAEQIGVGMNHPHASGRFDIVHFKKKSTYVSQLNH